MQACGWHHDGSPITVCHMHRLLTTAGGSSRGSKQRTVSQDDDSGGSTPVDTAESPVSPPKSPAARLLGNAAHGSGSVAAPNPEAPLRSALRWGLAVALLATPVATGIASPVVAADILYRQSVLNHRCYMQYRGVLWAACCAAICVLCCRSRAVLREGSIGLHTTPHSEE